MKDHLVVVSLGDPAGVGWPALIKIITQKKNSLISLKSRN
jgi:hypothetical protein